MAGFVKEIIIQWQTFKKKTFTQTKVTPTNIFSCIFHSTDKLNRQTFCKKLALKHRLSLQTFFTHIIHSSDKLRPQTFLKKNFVLLIQFGHAKKNLSHLFKAGSYTPTDNFLASKFSIIFSLTDNYPREQFYSLNI